MSTQTRSPTHLHRYLKELRNIIVVSIPRNKWNMFVISSSWQRLVLLWFTLWVILHLVSCLWFMIASDSGRNSWQVYKKLPPCTIYCITSFTFKCIRSDQIIHPTHPNQPFLRDHTFYEHDMLCFYRRICTPTSFNATFLPSLGHTKDYYQQQT